MISDIMTNGWINPKYPNYPANCADTGYHGEKYPPGGLEIRRTYLGPRSSTFYLLPSCWRISLGQHHLLRTRVGARNDSVDVRTGSHATASVVAPIPHHLVRAGRELLGNQRSYQTPVQAIDI